MTAVATAEPVPGLLVAARRSLIASGRFRQVLLKFVTQCADPPYMALRPATLEHDLLELEAELTTAWSARFGAQYDGATIPTAVVHELLVAITTGDTAELTDAAQALGILRAHEGRQASALVEDLLALRTTLWGRLSVGTRLADDPGELVMVHQRATDMVDAALRASVETFVRESQRVLSRRATRDPLTGVLNRSAFDEALASELASHAMPPAVLLVDLDGFKQVNDRLGHLAGDGVLVAAAGLMTDACRTGDVVGRLGGDEFAVLLPSTGPRDADKVAQRLLSASRTSDLLAPDGAERVGMSIGLAWVAKPATTEDLLHSADEAMYAAKRSGGSAVAHAVGHLRPWRLLC